MSKTVRQYRSVQWRIMVRQLPLILIVVVAILFWLKGHLEDALSSTNLEIARRSSDLAVVAVQVSMEQSGSHPDWDRLRTRIPSGSDTQIQIVNLNGDVVYATEPGLRKRSYRLTDLSCSPCHTAGSAASETRTTFIRGAGEASYQVFAAPLRNTPECKVCHEADGPKLGMVYVRQSLAPVNRLIRTTQIGLVIAGAVLLTLTVAMWRVLFWRFIGRPLKRLMAHARAIGSGDLESRVDVPDKTELAVLADTLNDSAERLRETIREVESQRDDLRTLYNISDNLGRNVPPEVRSVRAVELASSIYRSDCLLIAGHFHPESRTFHGAVIYRASDGRIVERPFPDEAVESAARYYNVGLVDQWLKGDLDGETRRREGSTVAYPLERHGRRLGIILAPARRIEDSLDGRATAANPQVVQALHKHLAIALELAELQREQLHRERLAAIGATVAGLAHCLKNNLNGLKGGQYVVERALEMQNAERLRQGRKILKDGILQIERLVQDMLFFAGERAPDLKPADPNEIAQEVIDLLRESASTQGVALSGELDERMITIPLDRHAIYRAVLNLATNAVDACSESDIGNAVILRTQMRPDSIVITVEDNGVGIPEEQLRRVTERFFTTKGSRGTGLGLPVALKIAQDHGGTVEVESEVGAGSSFHFKLPRPSVEESANPVSTVEARRVSPQVGS